MVVGAISSRTELAIVGAGPGGYVAALRAADAGIDVTLIEQEQLGGTCLNVGCIPSKALIEVANLRHHALHATTIGLSAQVDVHMDSVNSHLAGVTRQLRGGVGSLLKDAGVTVVTGQANIARYDRLSIAHSDQVSHLEFDNLILATGSRPIELPDFPIGGRVVTSTGALRLPTVPATLAVIGGGYIGVELGTAWAKLGAHVTIVEAADTILPDTPAELRGPVESALAALPVSVRTNCHGTELTPTGLALSDGTTVQAQVVVVAVGRRPNSDQASIDTLNLDIDAHGHILVDDHMRASQSVYAIGDLTPGPALAHKATAQAETAVAAIAGHTSIPPGVIPAVMFSDPEIMTVGVNLDDARVLGLRVHRFPHAASGRARTIGQDSGATYLVTDADNTIVGAHAVGPHASELAGEAALAVEMAATIDDVALTVHAHPTMSETLAEAAWLANGHPLHVRR